MSSEAVRELGLVPGVLAVAVVKSTQAMVEAPGDVHRVVAWNSTARWFGCAVRPGWQLT